MENKGHIQLRRGLMEHLQQGKMNGREFSVYGAIHFYADFRYGVAWKISAPFISNFLSEKLATVKRCLKTLSSKGYIKRFQHRGQKTFYPVLIDNYEIQKGIFTIADKTLNLDGLFLRVDFKCTLSVLQMDFKCPLSELYVSPIKEVNNIIINKSNKDVNNNDEWRKDLSVYQEMELNTFNEILEDTKFIQSLIAMVPGVNIKATLEKAHREYWSQEDGWKKKKASRSKTIDWRATYRKACTLSFNQVMVSDEPEYLHHSHKKL